MSSQELKFYKCKLCEEADLIAGNYCIECAKKNMAEKALNTKSKSPGYPFIDATLTSDYGYQDSTGTSAGSCTLGTTTVDQPIWTNFTASGNATNIAQDIASGTVTAVPSGSAMDLGFGTAFQIGQDRFSRQRKKTKHK